MEEQKIQITELEDELMLASDAKLRLEVNNAQLQKQVESVNAEKSEEDAAERKKLTRKVRELEDELEGERRSRSKMSGDKKSLEMQLAEANENLEEAIR